jgi:dipeptidyl aminopeptidase/acylaminoacyl peptidase
MLGAAPASCPDDRDNAMHTMRFLRLHAVLLPALAAGTLIAQEPANVLTPHEIARLRSVSGAVLSPDGSAIAYLLTVPRDPFVDEDGASFTELHVVDVATGKTRAYVTGKSEVSRASWTKDGTGIAFLAKRGKDEQTSLYVIPRDGGEARRAVSLKGAISTYDFSPDGKQVVCITAAPEDEAKKKEKDKGFKQEVYEEEWQVNQIWIASFVDEKVEPRRVPLDGHPYQAYWSPIDDRLLVARAPTPLVDDQYMKQRVVVLDGRSGDLRASFENHGKLGKIGWNPNGVGIAVISAADINDPFPGRLQVAPSSGGTLVDLLPDYPGDVTDFEWQDPDTVVYVADQGVTCVMESIDVVGRNGGNARQIVAPGGAILASISLSDDGMRMAAIASSPTHPAEVFSIEADGAEKRLTNSNPWLDEVRLAPQDVVKFAARDALELEGILVHPLDEVAGKRYPLVLYVHGGPEAHHSNGWLTNYGDPAQVLAARGIGVFHVNYRGSTGRGVTFSKLSQGDPAGKEFSDLVDAVDHLVETGLVDPKKVGITGGSYGGYATGWCSTRYTDHFAAGVMFVGISDTISKFGTTDISNEEFLVHARKHPWDDDWKLALERSPIYWTEGCKTPLLILHGKDDPRVDPGQSRELYRYLKLRGQAPVRLVHYPGEGHGNKKAAARLDYTLRCVQWFEHYLVGPGGAMPPYDIDHAEPKAAGADEPTGS